MANQTETGSHTIKLLTLIEASSVTGPAKVLMEFCQRARSLGERFPELPAVETSVVTFERGQNDAAHNTLAQSPNHFVAAAREAGIRVDVISERFRYDPRVIRKLRSLISERAPDIIETSNVKSHFLMRLSGLWRARPWVAFHHGYTTTDLKMRAYNKLDLWSLRAARRVITVSSAFAKELARSGVRPERISVQHCSIAAGSIANVSREDTVALKASLGIKAGERVVLAIGRLSREKGHADLISAFARLQTLHPSIYTRLVLAGDGPERRRLERLAASLAISDRVLFAGQVNDVRPYYAIADALALPSHSEGSPLVLLEAMAAGVPAVAAAVGGVPEMVAHNESALLVPPRDSQSMAEAIALVLTDRELSQKLTRNARAAVIANHSPEARASSLVRIYSGLARRDALSKARASAMRCELSAELKS